MKIHIDDVYIYIYISVAITVRACMDCTMKINLSVVLLKC